MAISYENINKMLGKMLASAKREHTVSIKKHPWKKSCLDKCVVVPHYINHRSDATLLGHIEALENVINNLIKMFNKDVGRK